MASQDGKGSIILKILIILLVVALVTVIILPGEIWQEEDAVQSISRGNMATLYEAYSYYHTLNNTYTDNEDEIIPSIQNDSALIKKQLVVNYTTSLKNKMESFLDKPAVNTLYDISSNLKNIQDDLELNKRFFKIIDEIDTDAENIKQQISVLRSGMDFKEYNLAAVVLDSMKQLRRDLADYSLQSAARIAYGFSTDIASNLPLIDFRGMQQIWNPLSQKISRLMQDVNTSRLKSLTSVADRVADFQSEVTAGFEYFLSVNNDNRFEEVSKASEEILTLYKDFLTDFLITQQYAQYNLSEADSLLINISQASFYTPNQKLRYIVDHDDSTGLRIEDPTLLAELKTKANATTDLIRQLAFISAFENYEQQIDSLKKYYPEIKKQYRRNIDVMIQTKEVEGVLDKLSSSAAFDAYLKEKSFIQIVPNSDSYSEIKNQIESSLLGIGTFMQVYGENFFGNLDTVHIEIIGQLNAFDELLSTMRRNTFTFQPFIENLNKALEQIKSVPKESVLPNLQKIDANLKELYLYASEGESKKVYGIFSKQIVNQGKIYGKTGRKSWEE